MLNDRLHTDHTTVSHLAMWHKLMSKANVCLLTMTYLAQPH